jgi:hypothetical protein
MSVVSREGRLSTDNCDGNGRVLSHPIDAGAVYYTCIVVEAWSKSADGTTSIYLNGHKQASKSIGVQAATTSLADAPFVIGQADTSRAGLGWQGDLFSIQVYGRALSEIEVQRNFLASRPQLHRDDFHIAKQQTVAEDTSSTSAKFKKHPGHLEYHWVLVPGSLIWIRTSASKSVGRLSSAQVIVTMARKIAD